MVVPDRMLMTGGTAAWADPHERLAVCVLKSVYEPLSALGGSISPDVVICAAELRSTTCMHLTLYVSPVHLPGHLCGGAAHVPRDRRRVGQRCTGEVRSLSLEDLMRA